MSSYDQESTGRFVEVDKLQIHFHDIGDGPALILLHGGGPGGSAWSNFHQNIPDLAKHFRLLLIDQPGYGSSDRLDTDEAYYIVAARVVRGVMDSLGISEADFIGNSLGGGTSLRLALDYPDYVRKLILMGPGGGAVNIFAPEPAEGQNVLRAFYAEPGPTREKMADLVRVMLFDQSFVNDELIDERFAAATAPGAREGALSALGSIGSPISPNENQLWRYLSKIPQKTLLIWGRDDRTMPLDGAFFALKQLPDARLHVFSRCGHWAQLEHCEAFNRLTVDFLLND